MKAITRAVDEALDEWYAKGYNDGLEAACRTDNRTLCKCVSDDIKERIEHYKNKENQEEQDKAEDVSEEDIVKSISEEEAKKIVWDEVMDLGYKEGLEKAWEAVKRIVLSKKDGGISVDECQDAFNAGSLYEIVKHGMTIYDVVEALDKHDEQNEIHVGDEVVFGDGQKAVVTKVYREVKRGVIVVCSDGCTKCSTIDSIKKTGDHFPEVGKMLEALRGEETE